MSEAINQQQSADSTKVSSPCFLVHQPYANVLPLDATPMCCVDECEVPTEYAIALQYDSPTDGVVESDPNMFPFASGVNANTSPPPYSASASTPSSPMSTRSGSDTVGTVVTGNAFHTNLYGQVRYVLAPPPRTIQSVEIPTPENACRLFFGQVKFECTAAELRWLIRRLCNITAIKIETRGVGCFTGYFKSQEDAMAVLNINKRVLFDYDGVWFANTPVEVSTLLQYTGTLLKTPLGRSMLRQAHLPHDAMVVEQERPILPRYQQSYPPTTVKW